MMISQDAGLRVPYRPAARRNNHDAAHFCEQPWQGT
jgi:hypothetical protein